MRQRNEFGLTADVKIDHNFDRAWARVQRIRGNRVQDKEEQPYERNCRKDR